MQVDVIMLLGGSRAGLSRLGPPESTIQSGAFAAGIFERNVYSSAVRYRHLTPPRPAVSGQVQRPRAGSIVERVRLFLLPLREAFKNYITQNCRFSKEIELYFNNRNVWIYKGN